MVLSLDDYVAKMTKEENLHEYYKQLYDNCIDELVLPDEENIKYKDESEVVRDMFKEHASKFGDWVNLMAYIMFSVKKDYLNIIENDNLITDQFIKYKSDIETMYQDAQQYVNVRIDIDNGKYADYFNGDWGNETDYDILGPPPPADIDISWETFLNNPCNCKGNRKNIIMLTRFLKLIIPAHLHYDGFRRAQPDPSYEDEDEDEDETKNRKRSRDEKDKDENKNQKRSSQDSLHKLDNGGKNKTKKRKCRAKRNKKHKRLKTRSHRSLKAKS